MRPRAPRRKLNFPRASRPPGSILASNSPGNVKIAGVKLTHPDRALYPHQGITKLELARYYQQVGDWMIRHVEKRPLTLVRCPEGHEKECFYQRHITKSMRGPIHGIRVREGRSTVSYISVDSTPGLIALVQIGVLEIHTWGSRQERLDQPDRLTFDLDPDPALPWKNIREAALTLRRRMADLGLGAFVKTTGGKGLHVEVPIIPKHNWDELKAFTKKVAATVAIEEPKLYTTTMSKAKRKGKIFIDYLRNARTATAVCAYSTRASAGAPVSVPVSWQELATDVREARFTIRNVPQRLARLRKDPWDGYEAARVNIPHAMLGKLWESWTKESFSCFAGGVYEDQNPTNRD